MKPESTTYKLLPPDPVARVASLLVLLSSAYSLAAYFWATELPLELGISVLVSAALVLAGQTQLRLAELRKEVQATNATVLDRVSNLESLYQSWKSRQRVMVVDDVKHDHQWRHIEGELHFYNALWTLPDDRFRDTFQHLLVNKRVPWKVVFFEGRTVAEKEKSLIRQERMQRAIKGILTEHPECSDLIEIRQARSEGLPELTFFLFTHANKKVARIYVDKLLISDIPEIAFDIYDDAVYQLLKREFESHFHEGKLVTLSPHKSSE